MRDAHALRQYNSITKSVFLMPARKMEEQVNVRFNTKLLALVDKAIDTGVANDRNEFIRMAVVEKLEKLQLFSQKS